MTTRIRTLLGCAAAIGLFALSASAAKVFAGDCDKGTRTWEQDGLHYTCYFQGYPGPNAEVSSYSRTDPNGSGKKQLIADLMAYSASDNAGYTVYAYAQGYDGNGNPITACRTQNDYRTGKGETVGNGSDCDAAATHHLFAKRVYNVPR